MMLLTLHYAAFSANHLARIETAKVDTTRRNRRMNRVIKEVITAMFLFILFANIVALNVWLWVNFVRS